MKITKGKTRRVSAQIDSFGETAGERIVITEELAYKPRGYQRSKWEQTCISLAPGELRRILKAWDENELCADSKPKA